MNSSDYTSIRVETSGGLFGLDPTQPGKERKRDEKNPNRKAKKPNGQADETDATQGQAEDPAADQEDPHTVDYRA
jgi:hypothetical protein